MQTVLGCKPLLSLWRIGMSRVQLAKIKSLTFYKDALTTARRTEPISQLNCVGKACQLYTPDVVRCVNIGGEGTDVDWKVCCSPFLAPSEIHL